MDFHKPKAIARPIRCKDGITLSVQASEYHYCSPRSDTGPYETVEVGYITTEKGNRFPAPRDWAEYAEGEKERWADVFADVPIEKVHAFIEAHGGIDLNGWL